MFLFLKHWTMVEVQKLNGPKCDMVSESSKTEVSEVLQQMTESPESLWKVKEATVKDIDWINFLNLTSRVPDQLLTGSV
jgi:hypothetical protein